MDYDSARHHLEAVQNAKKKDEAKTAKVKKKTGLVKPSCPPTPHDGGRQLGQAAFRKPYDTPSASSVLKEILFPLTRML